MYMYIFRAILPFARFRHVRFSMEKSAVQSKFRARAKSGEGCHSQLRNLIVSYASR